MKSIFILDDARQAIESLHSEILESESIDESCIKVNQDAEGRIIPIGGLLDSKARDRAESAKDIADRILNSEGVVGVFLDLNLQFDKTLLRELFKVPSDLINELDDYTEGAGVAHYIIERLGKCQGIERLIVLIHSGGGDDNSSEVLRRHIETAGLSSKVVLASSGKGGKNSRLRMQKLAVKEMLRLMDEASVPSWTDDPSVNRLLKLFSQTYPGGTFPECCYHNTLQDKIQKESENQFFNQSLIRDYLGDRSDDQIEAFIMELKPLFSVPDLKRKSEPEDIKRHKKQLNKMEIEKYLNYRSKFLDNWKHTSDEKFFSIENLRVIFGLLEMELQVDEPQDGDVKQLVLPTIPAIPFLVSLKMFLNSLRPLKEGKEGYTGLELTYNDYECLLKVHINEHRTDRDKPVIPWELAADYFNPKTSSEIDSPPLRLQYLHECKTHFKMEPTENWSDYFKGEYRHLVRTPPFLIEFGEREVSLRWPNCHSIFQPISD